MLVLFLALALLVVAAPAEATYPGRNGEIAFARHVGEGMGPPDVERWSLDVVSPGGGTPRTLVEAARVDSPSYSPDGRSIVFDAGSRLGLVALGPGGPTIRLLPAQTANDGDPAFGPGGKRIVFTGANERGTTDLYVRSVGGGPARRIVADADEPTWSSRNRIAYVHAGGVYARGRFLAAGAWPDWSPDGRRLALVRPDVGRLYVVGADGRGLRRVGRVRDASRPAWSPDGRLLAFDRFDSGIFVKRLGSRRPARLVAESQVGSEGAFVSSFAPAWRPLRR